MDLLKRHSLVAMTAVLAMASAVSLLHMSHACVLTI
jgi:hypothetical protein